MEIYVIFLCWLICNFQFSAMTPYYSSLKMNTIPKWNKVWKQHHQKHPHIKVSGTSAIGVWGVVSADQLSVSFSKLKWSSENRIEDLNAKPLRKAKIPISISAIFNTMKPRKIMTLGNLLKSTFHEVLMIFNRGWGWHEM